MSSTTRRVDAPPRRPLTELLDRQPPYDSQAEIGVLGSIVLLPDVLDDVVLILRPDDFHDDAHRKLFEHMCALHEANKKIDPTLLVDRLKSAGDFEAAGGMAYLSKIINAVPNAAHATYYAEIVREKSTFRSLIFAATEILRDAYDESQEAAHLLSQAEQKIFSILDNRSDSAVQSIRDVVLDAMERLDARIAGTHTAGGCDFGYRDLDGKTAGLHAGELVVLAARPSMGKTAFAMNVAENVAHQQNVPALFVSLEMSSLELADRMLCSVARVNGHRLRNGTVSQEDRIKLIDTAETLSRVPLFVDDSPSRTVTEISAAARRIKRRHGSLGLIVIDYLQLIEPDNPKDPRQEQVAKIARRLKGMAREMKVPVMCLAQLNRQTEAGKDNIPRLSHLRESGAIEQDADVVLFVHRESYYHRGEGHEDLETQAQIIIAKQRNGPVGEVNLEWLRDFTRFQDPVPERLKDFDQFNDRQMVDPVQGFQKWGRRPRLPYNDVRVADRFRIGFVWQAGMPAPRVVNPPEIIVFDHAHPCSYLPDRTARLPYRHPIAVLSPEQFDERLERGDRRSGVYLYRTECPTCRACQPIRLDVTRFRPDATQRRMKRKGDQLLTVRIGPPIVDRNRVRLFNLHRDGRSLASDDEPIDEASYAGFLTQTCCETIELSYWQESHLVAVAIADAGRVSLSAVYCYYDPAYRGLSVGTYSVLRHVELCQATNRRYLYLGFFIAESPHMSYKAFFRPHQRLIADRWHDFDSAR